MNVTESQLQELMRNVKSGSKTPARRESETVFHGPLDVTLTLHGHCPSKKSEYRSAAGGRLILSRETREQIEALTLQAIFQWSSIRLPIEHPEITTTFYVRYAGADEDGKYVTLMDILQKAGIIVNDNIKHFNGRKIHEPCVIVPEAEERVVIHVRKT